VVSLAGAIGRPRLSVTCLNRPRFAVAEVRFEADYGFKSDIAPSPKGAHEQTHAPQQTARLFQLPRGSSQGSAHCRMRRKMCRGWARPHCFLALGMMTCSAEDNAVNPPLDCSFVARRAGHLVPRAPLC
jgi:hypothetical protein